MTRDDEPIFTPAEEQRFDEHVRQAETARAVLDDILTKLRADLAAVQTAGNLLSFTLGREIKALEVCLLLLSRRVAMFSKGGTVS